MNVCKFERRVFAATVGAFQQCLIIAILVGGGTESRGSTACRHQLVFDAYDGYACDVIVTPSSNNGDSASEIVIVSNADVPANASALRLTLRRAAVDAGHDESRATSSMNLPQLRRLEVDVSETRSFPAGLLSKLGAVSLLRLSVFRSASTDVAEYRLRLPTSTEGTFATSNNSLSALVLSDLGIEELPLRTFDGLTSLCSLDVNNNRLSSLPAGLFDDLCQLSSLSISRNRFVDSEDLSLAVDSQPRRVRCGRGLARLRSLDLYGNQLRQLRVGTFRSLRSVVEINLSGNDLSVIEAGAFSGLAKLRALYIDDNSLVSVIPTTFVGLTGLTTLDMSYNRLFEVTSGLFQYLVALRRLRLRENKIQVIRPGAWTGLDALTEIDLASNRLTAVDESTFSGLCSLRKVDLSDNRIATASVDAFACLPALKLLELSGNLLSDAEQHRMTERWWSKGVGTGPPESCDKCVNTSMSTTPANISRGRSIYPTPDASVPTAPPSSLSSAVLRLAAPQILAVTLTISGIVAVLLLTLSVALYLYLLRRRQTMQRSATCTYNLQSAGSVCTLDDSIQGLYVKFHA